MTFKKHDLKRLSFFHPSPERNSYLRHYDIVKFDENFVLVFLVSCTRFWVQNPNGFEYKNCVDLKISPSLTFKNPHKTSCIALFEEISFC